MDCTLVGIHPRKGKLDWTAILPRSETGAQLPPLQLSTSQARLTLEPQERAHSRSGFETRRHQGRMPNSAIISAAKVRAPSRTKRRRWNSHLTLNLHGSLTSTRWPLHLDSPGRSAHQSRLQRLSLKGSLSTRRIIREL